ncbi:MAG: hypothetical protein D8M59_06635 [Planctomycetes bacterium]|nr:hypothetical protein [Planctomycetota bacterium]
MECHPARGGSLVFEEQYFQKAFESARGWPVRSCAFANDEAVSLIEASVVQGGSIVILDARPGHAYPHLVVNWPAAGLDVLIVLCVVGAVSIGWRAGKRRWPLPPR